MTGHARSALVREALASFGFADAEARLHSNETNALYRIRLGGGGPWHRPAGSRGCSPRSNRSFVASTSVANCV
ncbi:MAG: hypothetical protein ACOCY8_04405 [Spirochaetota bacterium]